MRRLFGSRGSSRATGGISCTDLYFGGAIFTPRAGEKLSRMRAASARSCGRTVYFLHPIQHPQRRHSDREVVDPELFGFDVLEAERFSETGQDIH